MGTRTAFRVLSTMVVVGALLYVLVCAYLWHAQRRLIFMPDADIDRTPADIDLEFREVTIRVGEGSALAAWWLPPRGTLDTESAVVLYLHGNDGNLARELPRLQTLHEYGLPILAIDYRGYGRSTGPFPSEAQVYDDAVAAWTYLVGVRRIEAQRIVIYGHSLGAAVAAELALRRGPACGVVLESAFTSMTDMARLAYPWIPVDLLLHQDFDVLRRIGQLGIPVVLVHGRADREVPSPMSERLYEAARDPKRLVLADDAGHEDAIAKAGEPLRRAVAELARRCGRGRD